MKKAGIIFFILLSALNANAQNFKGRITDKNGEPLYGSSVYIKEMNQGLVCNEEGYYQTTLKAGSFSVEYRCLGYKSIERMIGVKDNEITVINISLEENPFTLKEITVSNTEDPAYPIMRKAIEKAPVYAGAVEEYTADVYIKANGELLKISSFLDNMAKRGEGVKLSEFKDQLFVQESYNEIHYTAPDKYKQTVKAFSSSIPDNMKSDDAVGLINSSLYMPKVGMYVSPLNPKAFSYYRFRYEGFFEENGFDINKIKIEPKVKDPILFDGHIYIADNTWHIYSAELSTSAYGVKQNYNVSFRQLDENVYLPITYLIESEISILGLKAAMNYYTSVTYNDLKINNKIVQEQTEVKKKRNFELPRRDSLYTIVSDSLATKRDSAYWRNIRIIPLEERELATIVKKDSVQQYLDSVRKEFHNPSFSFGDLFSGGSLGIDSGKIVISYEGLVLGALKEYNFVDGLWLGQSFSIESKIGESNRLKFSPYIYYALSRKRLVGGGDIQLRYAPMRIGRLKISMGSTSENFNPDGIHRLNNFSSSLLTGKNYNYFYQKDFVSVLNNIDISNGLRMITGFEIARRSGLSNTTDYTWGKKSKIRPNIFSDDRFDKTVFALGFEYTPYAYYSVYNGSKYYVKYASPTLFIRYSQAFSSWQTNNAQYHKLLGGIQQDVKLSEFSNLNYVFEGGGFLGNKERIHFADFNHFNTSDVTVNFKSPFTSFMLLDNYIASTKEYWIKMNINYVSQYILLKRLPFLQGKMFSESLHLKSLYTPDMKLYTEGGYSINLQRLVNLGAFVSFRKGKYQDFGIRILLDWDAITDFID